MKKQLCILAASLVCGVAASTAADAKVTINTDKSSSTNNLQRGYYNTGDRSRGEIREAAGADNSLERRTDRGISASTDRNDAHGRLEKDRLGRDNSMNHQQGMERITRAKDLIGSEVKNQQGEVLGKIEDLAFDYQSGRISYAALSSGGFLGIRDRLYAIPLSSFTRAADSKSLILNIDKETLKNTAGFVKTHWPERADDSLLKGSLNSGLREPAGAELKVKAGDKKLEVKEDRR